MCALLLQTLNGTDSENCQETTPPFKSPHAFALASFLKELGSQQRIMHINT